MSHPRILIYEKSIHRASLLRQIVEQAGFSARTVFYDEEAETALKEKPFDLAIAGFDSFPVPPAFKKMKLIISAPEGKYFEVDRIAREHGASCATYPYRAEELLAQIKNKIRSRVAIAPPVEPGAGGLMPEILGNSPATRKMKELIAVAAQVTSNVLLLGETGTGKELAARALHRLGPTADGPFVAVNCAALPESLLETELFGHERGAFTGAEKKRAGKFEAAHGGMLLLDEAGEMPPSLQVKLLRVLETGSFYRVGGDTEITVRVRTVCATNSDIFELAQNGGFRRDLLYRINVISITMPPLREREEDIPELAARFLKLFGDKHGKPVKEFTKRAITKMMEYHWPGNIRQLQNCVERAVVHSSGKEVDRIDFGGEPETGRMPAINRLIEMDFAAMKEEVISRYESEYITALLKKSGGSILKTCELSGIDRKTLYRKMKQYGLDKKEFR